MARARARQERRLEVWGGDNRAQIVRLARSFPTLRRVDLEPWACSPACTSGGWHAAMFVLSVWNSGTNWATVARSEGLLSAPNQVDDYAKSATELGLVGEADEPSPEFVDRAAAAVSSSREFTFRPALAFAVWDEEHQQAFISWCQLPFFP